MIVVTALGLLGLGLRASGVDLFANPVLDVTLLILGSCGIISMLLPYTAEHYPLRIRGRATGWIAGCSKFGGLIAQGLSVLGAVPALGTAALAIGVPLLVSLGLIAHYAHETRGRDLRDLEVAPGIGSVP
jgi:putative MFS transporter